MRTWYEEEQKRRFPLEGVVIVFLLIALLASVIMVHRLYKELQYTNSVLETMIETTEKKDAEVRALEEELKHVLQEDVELYQFFGEREETYQKVFKLVDEEREYYKSLVPAEKIWSSSDVMDEILDKLIRDKDGPSSKT